MAVVLYHGLDQPATRRRARAAQELVDSYIHQDWLLDANISIDVRCYPGLFRIGTLYAVHLEASWSHEVVSADGLDNNLLGALTECFFHLRQRKELNEAF